MTDYPSYNGLGASCRTDVRVEQKENEKRNETHSSTTNCVTTQRPTPSTPSPRGHA